MYMMCHVCLPGLYNLKTRMKEALEDEEEYLKLDAVGKFQFKYNKVTALRIKFHLLFED